jgi:hypothetical protein
MRTIPTTLAAILTVFAFVTPAVAQISGAVSGCITAIELRRQGTSAMGALHAASRGAVVPLPGILIRFTFIGAGTNPNTTQLIQPVFVQTDNNGCYFAEWSDWTRNQFPTTARMSVLWSHSSVMGASFHPPERFSIRGSSGTRLTSTRTFQLGASTTVNRHFNGGVVPASYLTAWEFFDRIVDGTNGNPSNRLRQRMNGVEVWTRVTDTFGGGGVTPFKDRVLITANVPIDEPWVLAHELGHAVTWQGLNLTVAPIDPVIDYARSGPGWSLISRETERAAFLEGMASFFATAWMWRRDAAAPVVNRTTNSGSNFNFDYEAATATNTATGATLTCGTNFAAHERAFCHAAALWDLFDRPPGDDDNMQNRSQITIISTLNRFPDSCWFWQDGACSNEAGACGLNHLDFQFNMRADDQVRWANNIRPSNGLSGGC